MTAWTFNLHRSVDAPSCLKNGAMNYQQDSHAQNSADDQQQRHILVFSGSAKSSLH
jgi:hypothetical protein